METRRDYIMRMIEQVAICLQRILGLKSAGAYEEALQEVDRATDSLLGKDRELLLKVDAKTAVRLFADPRLIWTYARILSEKGEVLRLLGNVGEAQAAEVRALTLALEAHALNNVATEEHLWFLRHLDECGASVGLAPSRLELLKTLLQRGRDAAP